MQSVSSLSSPAVLPPFRPDETSAADRNLVEVPSNARRQTQVATTPENHLHTAAPCHPKKPCSFLLHGSFFGFNLAILVLLFLAWVYFNNYVTHYTANNIYGPSTGLPCASRMLSWMQALFGLSIATKLGLLWILVTEFLDFYVVHIPNKGLDCMIFASLVFKTIIPFGFGFKLFW